MQFFQHFRCFAHQFLRVRDEILLNVTYNVHRIMIGIMIVDYLLMMLTNVFINDVEIYKESKFFKY